MFNSSFIPIYLPFNDKQDVISFNNIVLMKTGSYVFVMNQQLEHLFTGCYLWNILAKLFENRIRLF